MSTEFDFYSGPPKISSEDLAKLIELAKTYALSHGLLYLPPGITSTQALAPASAIHAPFSLFPSPLPRSLYERAVKLQNLYNILYARVAMDNAFLDKLMGEDGIGQVDDFIENLWRGWKQLRGEGISQPLHLGLFRSDYLLHGSPISLKQVEFNTISSSFGSLSQKIAEMHQYLQKTTGYFNVIPDLIPNGYPMNDTISGLVAGLAAAHKAYSVSNSRILFVVQACERNVFDQRWLEYELLKKHQIHVIRSTFDALSQDAVLHPETQALTILPHHIEISTIYFRAGYTPNDYPTSEEYRTRVKLERSKAIKCPTIALQLAGAKAVQAELAQPSVLERFLHDRTAEEIKFVRDSFMGMWNLGSEGGVERALKYHDQVVLKPQREGGGNNVYTSSIPKFLAALPEKERGAWIGMELISPPNMSGYLVRSDASVAVKADVISELGIFGWALFGMGEAGKESIDEQQVGWLVRTKARDNDEGGVAAGFSVLDSILLVEG